MILDTFFNAARATSPPTTHPSTGQMALALLQNPHLTRTCHIAILQALLRGKTIRLSQAMRALGQLASILPEEAHEVASALSTGRMPFLYCLRNGIREWTQLWAPDDWDRALASCPDVRAIVLQCPGLPLKYERDLLELPNHYKAQALLENPTAISSLFPDCLADLRPGQLLSIRALCSSPMIIRQIDTELARTLSGIRAMAKHNITPTAPIPRQKIAKLLASKSAPNVRARPAVIASLPRLSP